MIEWQEIDKYDIGYNNMYHDLRGFIKNYAEDDSRIEPIRIDSERSGYSSLNSLYTALRYTIRQSKYTIFLDVSRKKNMVILSKVYCPIVSTRKSQML